MKVIKWLDVHFEECLMIVLMAVVTVVMICQVFLRYVFSLSCSGRRNSAVTDWYGPPL